MSTLADFAAEVVARVTPALLGAVGLPVAADATNDPAVRSVAWGFRKAGLSPSLGGLSVADGDLGSVTTAQADRIADLSEYQLLFICRNAWFKTNIQVGSNALYLSALRDSLDRRLEALEKLYRLGVGSLSGGSVAIGVPPEPPCDEFGGWWGRGPGGEW